MDVAQHTVFTLFNSTHAATGRLVGAVVARLKVWFAVANIVEAMYMFNCAARLEGRRARSEPP
jgi:ABC-type uncharacterized transport system permease subunit